MKKINPSEIWQAVFVLILISISFFLNYLFSQEEGYRDMRISVNVVWILILFAILVLIPMVFVKAKKISKGRLTLPRFLKEVFKLNRNEDVIVTEYNEKDASDYVYNGLDIFIKNKFQKWEIDKILEHISFFTNEKNIEEDQLFYFMKKDFPNLTETELITIKKLEVTYIKSLGHNA